MKKFFTFILVFFVFISPSLAFSDEHSYAWAKEAIDKWSLKGYISGYPDGTFRGNNNITRAEVIAVINKLNNSNIVINKRAGKDVSLEDWFFLDMGKAVEAGFISADTNGNLRPNEMATREEVIVILSKLLNISYSGNLNDSKVSQFLDSTSISPTEYKRVAGIVEEGFVKGYLDNTLRPQNNITRAEFICILNNAITEIYNFGKYNNHVISGNIIINGENVEIINSEVNGKIFVLDGARNGTPSLINTRATKGINSRVGEILLKNTSEIETVTEHNFEDKENTYELAFAKITYSETDWTNRNVKATIKISNNDYKILNGDKKITFEKNGEKEIEFEYEGDIIRVKAKVDNIDKIVPKINVSSQTTGNTAIITVEVEDDGLSPIKEISCNSMTNMPDKETGIIENTFVVTENGKYIILVEDEAGNVCEKEIKVKDILIEKPDIPDSSDKQEEKPLTSNGNIAQASDGTGGTGNGKVIGKTLTFSGVIPYYTSSISDKRGNWVGAKITSPTDIEIKSPKLYADGVLTDSSFINSENSFLYYEKPVIGKTTTLKVIWNEEYEADLFYITISEKAVLEASTTKAVTINPNGGIWNNSSFPQTLNAGALEKVKIVDPKNEILNLKLDANEGDIATDTEYEINKFLGWELLGVGEFKDEYYIFGEGEGTLTAKYLTEIELPVANKSGYIHTGWFTEKIGGKKVGEAGDKYSPTENITLYAQFTENIFELKVKTKPTAAGSVVGVKDFYYNELVTLTAEPIEGYCFDSWEVDGINIEQDKLKLSTLTFNMPNNKVEIVANFNVI